MQLLYLTIVGIFNTFFCIICFSVKLYNNFFFFNGNVFILQKSYETIYVIVNYDYCSIFVDSDLLLVKARDTHNP